MAASIATEINAFMQASFYIIVHNGFSMNFSIRGSSTQWSCARMVRMTALNMQVCAMLEDNDVVRDIIENALYYKWCFLPFSYGPNVLFHFIIFSSGWRIRGAHAGCVAAAWFVASKSPQLWHVCYPGPCHSQIWALKHQVLNHDQTGLPKYS